MNKKARYYSEYSWIRYCYSYNGNPFNGRNAETDVALKSFHERQTLFTGWVNKARRVDFIAKRAGSVL